MKKITTLAILCIFLMLFTPQNISGDQLADIESADKIVIGMDTTYPPFEYLDGTEKIGFSVDFGEALARKLNVTAEFKTVAWESIIPSLDLAEFDVIISSMTITEARDEIIDFSRPYYNSSQGILVAQGNPLGIVDETDLDDAGITIGVQVGTTSDIWATANASSATLVKLANFDELYLKLENAEIDVILGDFPVIAYAANQGQTKGVVIGTFGSAEQFGVGIREGEPALLNAINDAINEMLTDGTYDYVFNAWFGPPPDGQFEDIKTAGKIVIGMDTTYPPFEYLDGTEKVGFSVDFGEALAEKLGVTAEFKTVAWESIIPSLDLAEFDIIISSMTITAARDEIIDFSRPYYNSSQGILVAKGNPLSIVDETDLDDSGITIGVQVGTTSDIWATANASSATLVKLANFDELYLKLENGEIDVILGDFPVIAYAANQGQTSGVVIGTFGSAEQFGVGIREGEPSLLNAINGAIDVMLIDGTYDEVFNAWFGPAAASTDTDDDTPIEVVPVIGTLIFVTTIVTIRRRRKN